MIRRWVTWVTWALAGPQRPVVPAVDRRYDRRHRINAGVRR